MWQGYRKNKNELSQKIRSEGKDHQLVEQSPKMDCNPASLFVAKSNRHIENTREYDSVLRVYRCTGFVYKE